MARTTTAHTRTAKISRLEPPSCFPRKCRVEGPKQYRKRDQCKPLEEEHVAILPDRAACFQRCTRRPSNKPVGDPYAKISSAPCVVATNSSADIGLTLIARKVMRTTCLHTHERHCGGRERNIRPSQLVDLVLGRRIHHEVIEGSSTAPKCAAWCHPDVRYESCFAASELFRWHSVDLPRSNSDHRRSSDDFSFGDPLASQPIDRFCHYCDIVTRSHLAAADDSSRDRSTRCTWQRTACRCGSFRWCGS
jgi:hypothetical protein